MGNNIDSRDNRFVYGYAQGDTQQIHIRGGGGQSKKFSGNPKISLELLFVCLFVQFSRSCSGYIPDRQILYYSPEQMRCLRIKDQNIHCDKSASMAGDVYAYG